jgi:hypothetical protein
VTDESSLPRNRAQQFLPCFTLVHARGASSLQSPPQAQSSPGSIFLSFLSFLSFFLPLTTIKTYLVTPVLKLSLRKASCHSFLLFHCFNSLTFFQFFNLNFFPFTSVATGSSTFLRVTEYFLHLPLQFLYTHNPRFLDKYTF